MKVPGQEDIDKAVNLLRNGGVIALPSDTLYALGASASDSAAVQRVFEIKGREAGKALLLLVSDLAMAERVGELNGLAKRLASRFWPGQLTLVVNKRPDYESEALSGGTTVGLRAPDDATARAVITGLGGPVTGTSANLSGGADPVSADEVRRQLDGRIDLVLDAGPAAHGVASTIVDCTGPEPVVLREGSLPAAAILDSLRD